MAMEVNGAAILHAIARTPSAFAMTDGQVSVLAMQTLLHRLKDKALDLKHIRSIATAIGPDDFSLTLDHLATRDLVALTKRLDPKHPDLKTADEQWHRAQLVRLAKGSCEPVVAAVKAVRAPKTTARTKTPKTGEIMKSEALAPKAPAKKAAAKKKSV